MHISNNKCAEHNEVDIGYLTLSRYWTTKFIWTLENSNMLFIKALIPTSNSFLLQNNFWEFSTRDHKFQGCFLDLWSTKIYQTHIWYGECNWYYIHINIYKTKNSPHTIVFAKPNESKIYILNISDQYSSLIEELDRKKEECLNLKTLVANSQVCTCIGLNRGFKSLVGND